MANNHVNADPGWQPNKTVYKDIDYFLLNKIDEKASKRAKQQLEKD